MRFSRRFLIMLIPALVVLALSFIGVLDRLEQRWTAADLSQRSRLVADGVQHSLIDAIKTKRPELLQRVVGRTGRDARLIGIVVCGKDGRVLSRGTAVPKIIDCAKTREAREKNQTLLTDTGPFHEAFFPLRDDDESILGSLIVVQDARVFAGTAGMLTRKYLLFAFFGLVFLVAVVTVYLYRWSASRRVDQMSQALKGLLKGDVTKFSGLFEAPEYAPLVKDLNKVLLEFGKRKKLSQPLSHDSLFNPERLREEVNRLFPEARICVVANREPYVHNRKGKKIETVFPASGLVTAMEPIVRACAGLWIGHGSGTADRETADKRGVILVPPGKPEYALKRVWLTREEEEGYYYGFANEGLWPLCHIAHTRPIFRESDWRQYTAVNEKFADAFVEEMTSTAPIALIQDYHFALLPGILRKRRPDAVTSLFWHIPWPNPEAIRICPWKTELLKGMLGADLIGFHIQQHCNNFLDAVETFLEARVDYENFSVTMRGHTCYVKPFPISVEWPPKHEVGPEAIPGIRSQLLEELAIPQDTLMGIGVDRMDYTKGIVERLLAVERMLEKHPEMVGRFVFIQISAPSRTQIKRYQELDLEVRETAHRVNARFHKPGYEPIVLRTAHHDSEEVFRFYRAANVCVVTSLHDGMNLVAKEFVAARCDKQGALVISNFTGAARELKDGFLVNPYDIEETADAIYQALTLPPEEQEARMARMRELVSTRNVYDWAARFLREIHRISERKPVVKRTQA